MYICICIYTFEVCNVYVFLLHNEIFDDLLRFATKMCEGLRIILPSAHAQLNYLTANISDLESTSCRQGNTIRDKLESVC